MKVNIHFENPILVKTSKKSCRKKDKGGVVSYEPIRFQVDQKCKEDKTAWVTTMLDYYGLPADFPGQWIHRS